MYYADFFYQGKWKRGYPTNQSNEKAAKKFILEFFKGASNINLYKL